MIKAKAKRKS